MRSCCIALGTILSHLWWNMMEDNVRIRMYICMCDRVTLMYSKKLTECCKPTIMEKIKIILKKVTWGYLESFKKKKEKKKKYWRIQTFPLLFPQSGVFEIRICKPPQTAILPNKYKGTRNLHLQKLLKDENRKLC